jgi:hypothetical protein
MRIQPGTGYTFDSSSKGFTLDTSDPFPSSDSQEGCTPFKFKYLGYDSGGDAHSFNICVGTMNNLVPQLEEDSVWVKLDRLVSGVPSPPVGILNFTSGLTYLYLRVGVDTATPPNFPSSDDTTANYPRFISSGTVLSDSDTYGYILVAHGSANSDNVLTMYQDVSGSLWGDRVKINGRTASYYYARI